jgi:hypothetical protein
MDSHELLTRRVLTYRFNVSLTSGYWRKVAARAWRETRGEVRWDSPVRIIIAVGSPLAVGAVTWKVSDEIAWSAIASIGFVVLVAFATFLTKMAKVPAALAREQDDAAAALQAKIEDKASQVEFKTTLLAFAAEGERLIGCWNTDDSDQLYAETEAWGNRVMDYLNSLGDEVRGKLFASDVGITFTQYATPRARPSMAANWLRRRLYRIDQFVRGQS